MAFIDNTCLLIVVVTFITNFVSCSENFPSEIERCKNEDKECLKNAWNKYIRMSHSKGIQQLDIPDLRNYFISKATITPSTGPLDLVLKLRNFNITGFDEMFIDKISGFPRDPKKMSKFELIGRVPYIQLKGKYNVKGKILLLPVAGDSDAEVVFHNVKANVTATTDTKVIDGEEYLVISKVTAIYTSERNEYQFDNLLNNKEISDSVNKIINENQDIINKEIEVPVGEVLAVHFKKFFVAAFKKYPYRSFFLQA